MKAEKTLNWIRAQELPTGGIAAWPGVSAYKEVTGYLIPTLENWGQRDLARRLGDWLVAVQNKDGSFDGIDGIPRAFDTAACVEGLNTLDHLSQAKKAMDWIATQFVMTEHGYLLKDGGEERKCSVYGVRAMAIIGRHLDIYTWIADIKENLRTHYYLYALEGLWNMGHEAFVIDQLETIKISHTERLLPSIISGYGSDTCATAQAACLRLRAGLDAQEYIDVLDAKVNNDGSLPHDNQDNRRNSWACKYYLDMLYYAEQA